MTGRDRISFALDSWATWDGTDASGERVRAVAPGQFEVWGGLGVFRRADGRLEEMAPGWVVYRPEGAARATACTPEAWAAMGGPQVA